MSYFIPAQCTERIPGGSGFTNCGPASACMAANANHGNNAIPQTYLEMQAFRKVAGATATEPLSNLDIERGMRLRYGEATTLVLQFPAIWNALTPGKGAIVAGILRRFPEGHRLLRWDRFRGSHWVWVQRNDTQNRIWWMDPRAPVTYKDRSGHTIRYRGEWVSKAELGTFLGAPYATSGRTALVLPLHAVAPPVYAKGEPMLLADDTVYAAAAGITLYDTPNGTAIGSIAGSFKVTSSGIPFAGKVLDDAWRQITWTLAAPDGKSASKRVFVRRVDLSAP